MADHISSKTQYAVVWLLLMMLLGATIGAHFIATGPLSLALSLGIAVTKAFLVALYFMHLRHSPWVLWMAAGAGVYWLAILLLLSMSDFATRQYFPK